MENKTALLLGGSPGETIGERIRPAALRAMRTFLQGAVASFGTGFAGATVITAGYWKTVAISLLAAFITALLSFVQNLANIFDPDPTQRPPPVSPARTPQVQIRAQTLPEPR